MNFIKGISLLLCLFFAHSIAAQPQFWRGAAQIETGKNANFYARKAKKEAKNGKMIKGLMYAAKSLNTSPKKKNIKTAVDVLNTHYQYFITSTESSIAKYQEESKVITKDKEVNNRYAVVRLSTELDRLQQLLKEVPSSNFKPKKDPAFTYTPKDYSSELSKAKNLLEAGKMEILEIHYSKGLAAYNTAKTVQNYRYAAMILNMAMDYDKQYKNVAELYPKAKEKGTTRLIMHSVKIPGAGMINDLTSAQTENHVSSYYYDNSKNKFPYFDFYPADPSGTYIVRDLESYNRERNNFSVFKEKEIDFHFRLISSYLRYNIDEKPTTSNTENVTKEIVIREEKYKDAEGKEKKRKIKGTVRANITYFTKQANIELAMNAKIQKIADESIVQKGDYEVLYSYSYEWATYTGDKRALESYHLSSIEKKPQPRLDIKTAMNEASEKLGDDIGEKLLLPFALKYGAGLRPANN